VPVPEPETVSGEKPLGPALVESLGGKRGLVDSGLPAVVFVGVNALVDIGTSRSVALRSAIAAAVLTGVAIVVLRLVRKETVQQAVSGFFGLALAVFFAARSGEARDFFKPGIYINLAYGAVFLGSAIIGRPLVGVIYAAEAAVQTYFYNADRTDLLAISKLALGWPLTIGAVALTVAYVRRSHRLAEEAGTPTG
jgi:hypothetical protein